MTFTRGAQASLEGSPVTQASERPAGDRAPELWVLGVGAVTQLGLTCTCRGEVLGPALSESGAPVGVPASVLPFPLVFTRCI